MRFLGNVLAVIVGLLIFSVMSFFILAGIIAIASSSEDKIEVKENTVFHLDLNGKVLVERTNEDDFDISSITGFGGIPAIGLVNLKKAIRTAKENDNVKGIYLEAGLVSAGQAMLWELREELEEFKTSGKFIISYGEAFSEGGYFLTSVSDEIYLNPIGGLEFNGFASEVVFLKGLFEKLEIEPVVFRVGEFKSAVEPFILSQMSEESRLQTLSFLNDLNNFAIEKISESRGIPYEKLFEINSQMLVRTTEDAKEQNLVDELWYEDQVIDLMKDRLGLGEDDNINTINVTRINKTSASKNRLSPNRIAVIIAEGEIVSGNAEGVISSDKFVDEIRKARKNKDIKAIVLRVNSPGGSVLASEVIWREMSEAQKVKPVIASMGEVAASGGYYISAPADTIVAQANTITGSIGIFGLWFNAEGLLNNKLGITTDVVKTGELSDFMSPTGPLSEVEKTIIQKNVEDGYEEFISKVVEGRNMSYDDVLNVASGRVWSGLQAKENGLVDVLGGLDVAIDIAAAKANVSDDFRVVYYPEEKPWFERIMQELTNEVKVAYSSYQLGSLYPIYQQLEKSRKYEGILVRMPYDLVIR
jgi:protease IV